MTTLDPLDPSADPSDRHRAIGRRGLLAAATAATAVVATAATSGAASAASASSAASAASGQTSGPSGPGGPGGRGVRCGADIAAADGWKVFSGRNIGIITNPTGLIRDGLASIVDVMVASGQVQVGAVFGPEHGFRGTAQAGDSEGTYVDERTGVTVYDAYGATVEAFEGFYAAAGIDTVVFDIQDVGARFYTYIWTMYTAMAAAARSGKAFIVLDRPNPVGGSARGPVLHDGFTSGVGLDKIAQQHGMTAGEVARYFNGEFMQRVAGATVADLQVVRLEGWSPRSLFAETGLPWILPSPNMPTSDTALLYPGTCLFEATNLSEGRGTTHPFELIGAPYVDFRWAQQLTAAGLPGVEFREAYFTPTFSKNANLVCGGVQVHLTDRSRLDAILVATTMLTTLRDLYAAFDWRGDAGRWISLLTGSDRFLTMFTAGASAQQIIAAWQPELRDFDRSRQKYLLYRR